MRLLPGWLAGQEGGQLDARRRRLDPPPPGRPRRGAAARGWAPGSKPPTTATHPSPSPAPAERDRVRAPGRLRAGQVVRAVRRAAGVRPDHGRRARAEPRPHRADAGRRGRADRPRRRARHGRPQDELELGRRCTCPATRRRPPSTPPPAVLVPGSRIVIEGMGANWTRTGFFQILDGWAGGRGPARAARRRAGGGRAGARARRPPGRSIGTVVEAEEVPLAIDELPLVALLGCSPTANVVRGAQELRLKESDRIATVVDGLRGLGGRIEATEDGFAVQGGGGLRGGVLTPTATTGWRCSARSPASPRARAWRSGNGGRRSLLSRLRGRSRCARIAGCARNLSAPWSSPSTAPRGRASPPSRAPSRKELGFTIPRHGGDVPRRGAGGELRADEPAARVAAADRLSSVGDRVRIDGRDVNRGDSHARGLGGRVAGGRVTSACAPLWWPSSRR